MEGRLPAGDMYVVGAFALSFTLIIFAGAELFTGNVFVMTVGILTKTVKAVDYLRLLILCYIANFAGACLMGWIFAATGLMNGRPPMKAEDKGHQPWNMAQGTDDCLRHVSE